MVWNNTFYMDKNTIYEKWIYNLFISKFVDSFVANQVEIGGLIVVFLFVLGIGWNKKSINFQTKKLISFFYLAKEIK